MTYVFNAGPATLPKEVLKQAQAELVDFHGVGYSILEASHRSAEFDEVIGTGESLIRELLGISDDYAVLFLQGGASTQFCMIPMNFMGAGQSADYIDTGAWSSKAFKEADNLGQARVIASSKDKNYSYIPKLDGLDYDPQAAYLHITANNTIFGTEYAGYPSAPAGVPLIADMSSDYLSRPLDVNKFGMIYGGAQKNIGPAGVTLVILRRDLAERSPKSLPTMLNYNTHIGKGSMFNTPPTFGIYMVKLVAEWLKKLGGLEAMARMNDEKADLLYGEIDADDFYRGVAAVDSRSKMNVTFNLATEELEKKFVAAATAAGLIGLKGHRSVGGCRASIYNAMPLEGVQALVSFMQDFRQANG